MKAYLKRNGDDQTIIRLQPENPGETDQIKKFVEDASRGLSFLPCGYEYMSPIVSFTATRPGRD